MSGFMKRGLDFAQMPATAGAGDNDLMIVRQNGADRKVTFGALRSDIVGTAAGAAAEAAATSSQEAEAARSGAEAARDAAQLVAGVFATPAEGLAATAAGKYFSVPASGTSEFLILYKNNAGVALEVKRYPSAEKLDEVSARIAVLPTSNRMIPIVTDEAGNVPLWLEDGALGVAGFAPGVNDLVREGIGLLNTSASNSFLPLVADEDGNVPLWLEGGKLGALGLAPSLIEAVAADLPKARPMCTDGSTLHRWRARLAAVAAGAGVARVVLTGDSWAEQTPIGSGVLAALREKYAITASGYRESNAAYGTFDGNQIVFVNTTWTRYDAGNGAAPLTGCGMDGHARTATGVTGTFELRTFTGTGVSIYYTDTDGSFEYEIDGSGIWTPVIGKNTNALSKVTVSGLPQGVHSLKGRLANNGGTVQINGIRAFSTAPGIELSKAGNGGLRGNQFPLFADQIPFHAADIQPDVVVVVIGTNDYRSSLSSVAGFVDGLSALVNAYRSAVTDVGIVIVAPADTNGVPVVPLVDYVQAAYDFARANGCEFYSAYDDFGSYAQMNALGVFADTLHLNDVGGRMLGSRLVNKHLFF